MRKVFVKKYPTKVRCILGPEAHDDKEGSILNRIVQWRNGEVSFDADPKHVEKMLTDMNLAECRPNIMRGVREDLAEHTKALEGEQLKVYRSVVARANCLSQDRADIRFALKELCRHMSWPTVSDLLAVKRLCRYLRVRARMVQERVQGEFQTGVIEVWVDADWAGCPEARRSTSGGALMVHGVCLRTWSTTQRVVARSSGEAELYAAVRGASEGLGLRSMAQDLGWRWSVRVLTDSSACRGTCGSGLGRLKHLAVEDLWIQDAVKQRSEDNVADLLTKHLARTAIDKHAAKLGHRDF